MTRAAPPAPAPRRRWSTGALIALAALLLVVGAAAAALLSGGGDPDSERPARQEPKATATPDRTATPEESTPTPTATATATAEATAEPQQDNGKAKGKKKAPAPSGSPTQLQLQAFNLNNAGQPEQALPYAQQAVELCKGSTAIDPCAYALFEYARSLRMTGDAEGAIAALEERKQRFPDNQPDAVERELQLAREAAGG